METLQPNVGAAISITYSSTFLAFVLRFFARTWNGVPFIAGDWVSASAFFFVTNFNILYFIKLEYGLGLHCANIAKHNHHGGIHYDRMTQDYFLLLYPDMWLYTAAMGLSKMTALALYWHLFGRSVTQRWILLLVGCVVWWMFARFVVILAVCQPISKFWSPKGLGHCPVNMARFFYGSTAHLALEICIVALPWYELRRLKRAKAEKLAVAALFSSGILVCIASLVQLILATQLDTTSQEIWWINTPQAIASIVEINLAHFSTSLPNLRPFLRCFSRGECIQAGTQFHSEDSSRLVQPSNSNNTPWFDVMRAQRRKPDHERLVARTEQVDSVRRITEIMPSHGRPGSKTGIVF